MTKKYGMTKNGFIRKTYNDSLEDLKARARQEFGDDINLSDNSVFGKTFKTIAWAISDLWEKFENSHYQSFLLTTEENGLDLYASNFQEKRKAGSKAKSTIEITGTPNFRLEKGLRVRTISNLIYETDRDLVLNDKGKGTVGVTAIEKGSKYNIDKGFINGVVNPNMNITKVENIKIADGGTDVQTDEDFRDQVIFKLRVPLTGDNPNQYIVWSQEVYGVGSVKVLRATPEAGYVTIIISTDTGRPASDELVSDVKDHIMNVKPAGAGIVVKSATERKVDISVKVSVIGNANIENVKEDISRNLSKYFAEVGLYNNRISFAKIGNIILNTDNVDDYTNLLVDGKHDNVILEDVEVAVLGELEVGLIERNI